VEPEKRTVRVQILGQVYSIITQDDPRDVEELAQQVDDLMNSIARKLPNADSTRIAVLSCLHLADRLQTQEKDLSGLKERVDQKSQQFRMLLEQALHDREA
jgi:cell division protein ZapA